MMKKLTTIALLSLLMLITACKKDAGDGGQASISGKILKEYRLVLSNPSTTQSTVPAADADVYIIYGDHTSPDDRIWTNYNGEFKFRFLREGKYKIYTYSKDINGSSSIDPNKMVVLQEVEISDKKEDKVLSNMTIYDTP